MPSRPNCRTELEAAMRQRILVIDGAMGTTIRGYKDKGVLDEASARGERFRDNEKDILNNGDILSITRPDIIEDIHRRFLEAGADIIETNTFSATSIAQSEFYTSVSEMGIIAGSRSAAPAGVGRCSLIWKESSGCSRRQCLLSSLF
jgi:5-methyltetrahydrofolate--homocysteine methyltransferase